MTGKARRGALCLSLLLATGLIATSATGVRADDTDTRLDHLENEVQTLSRAVFKGDMPNSPDSVEAIPGGASAAASASAQLRMSNLEQAIQQLTNKVEEQGNTIQQLQHQLATQAASPAAVPAPMKKSDAATGGADPAADATTSDLDSTPPAAGSVTTTTTSDATTSTVKQLGSLDQTPGGALQASSADPANQYEQAFSALRNRQYDDAEKGFTDFLAKYPNSALAPNAQYWLGESYYARNDFQSASRAFATAYQKYPKGAKAPDSLLKLAMSLAGLNKKDDACLSLAQLKREYATNAGAVLARADQESTTLGCK